MRRHVRDFMRQFCRGKGERKSHPHFIMKGNAMVLQFLLSLIETLDTLKALMNFNSQYYARLMGVKSGKMNL